MTICIATTDEQLNSIATVLLQLRPQYDQESLIKQIKKQQANGFNIAYHEIEGQVSCGHVPGWTLMRSYMPAVRCRKITV